MCMVSHLQMEYSWAAHPCMFSPRPYVADTALDALAFWVQQANLDIYAQLIASYQV